MQQVLVDYGITLDNNTLPLNTLKTFIDNIERPNTTEQKVLIHLDSSIFVILMHNPTD